MTDHAPDHPAPQDPVPASPMTQLRDELARTGWRLRRQALPLAFIGGTHAVGALADTATGAGALAAVAGGWVAAGGAYVYARHRIAPGAAGRWQRLYAAVASASSAAWIAAAGALGATGVLPGALWLGGCALALPWWRRHAEPDPDITAEQEMQANIPEPEPKTEPAPPPPPDPRTVRFGTYLGGRNKPLAGAKLAELTEIRFGWKATIELPRGSHWSQAAGQLDRIASVYDLPDGRAAIEPIPDEPVHRARLTVLTSNPLHKPMIWPGPRLDPQTGTFPIALTGDGELLPLRLWWPGSGTCHVLVSGTKGSGKSRTLDLILAEVTHSDRLYPVVIDASGGQSLPDWLEVVPKAATNRTDAKALLRWAEHVMRARNEHYAKVEWTDERGRRRRGRNSIDPTPQAPGIVIIIDEAHELLMGDRDARRLVEQLTQMGRKTAISVVLATQVASVAQLGGSNVIRDMIKSDNVIALRTADRGAGGMVTDVPPPEPLNMLPRQWADGTPTQGLGYVMTARLIRSRTLLIEDPFEWAQTAPRKTLDPVSAAVPVPGSGDDDPGQVQADLHIATSDGPTTTDQVQAAIAGGVPADDIAALVQTTGLSPRAVKSALRQPR